MTLRHAHWIGAMLLTVAPSPALSQSVAVVSVQAEQGLTFGQLFPGQVESVSILDVPRRAVVSVTGQGKVQVHLVLPQALTSHWGTASLPIRFSPTDGGVLYPQSSRPETFDPAFGTTVNLNKGNGSVRILVGASAEVRGTQPAGPYNGTIVVVVSNMDT